MEPKVANLQVMSTTVALLKNTVQNFTKKTTDQTRGLGLHNSAKIIRIMLTRSYNMTDCYLCYKLVTMATSCDPHTEVLAAAK